VVAELLILPPDWRVGSLLRMTVSHNLDAGGQALGVTKTSRSVLAGSSASHVERPPATR
jgi:hypothetical protein